MKSQVSNAAVRCKMQNVVGARHKGEKNSLSFFKEDKILQALFLGFGGDDVKEVKGINFVFLSSL